MSKMFSEALCLVSNKDKPKITIQCGSLCIAEETQSTLKSWEQEGMITPKMRWCLAEPPVLCVCLWGVCVHKIVLCLF